MADFAPTLSTLHNENVLRAINENVCKAIFIETFCHLFIVDGFCRYIETLNDPHLKAAPVPTFFIFILWESLLFDILPHNILWQATIWVGINHAWSIFGHTLNSTKFQILLCRESERPNTEGKKWKKNSFKIELINRFISMKIRKNSMMILT